MLFLMAPTEVRSFNYLSLLLTTSVAAAMKLFGPEGHVAALVLPPNVPCYLLWQLGVKGNGTNDNQVATHLGEKVL
jgi:hypothetical protein